MSDHYLKALFDPRSVVIIGASESENTLAACITQKLHEQFTGKLYFVNPRHKTILGQSCVKKVTDLKEEPIDLAIIVSPVKTAEKVIRQCAQQGISNVTVMTKFKTTDKSQISAGMKSLHKVATEVGVRLLGPNASALVRPSSKLNASTTNNQILPGKLALVSRSTAICNSILDWAETEELGFSLVISRGATVDVDLADILDFLASDYRTNSIILYISHIKNSRRFMSALQAAAKVKPVVILKASHENGSYSNAITKTSDVRVMHDVFLTAVLRAGADHVTTLTNLFIAAKILGSSQRTKGSRLGMISNGYGPVMLANDRLRDLDFETITFSPELVNNLTQSSKNTFCIDNSIIVADKANIPTLYAESLERLLASKEVDAVVIMLAPDAMINSQDVATRIAEVVKKARKPVLAVWLGTNGRGRKILIKEKVSNYRTPEGAIDAFSFLCHHHENRKRLLQIPFPLKKTLQPRLTTAQALIQKNLDNQRNVLSKQDATALLQAFYIPCNASYLVDSEAQALEVAEQIGYPIELKLDSPHMAYNADVVPVKPNIQNADMLASEYQQMQRSVAALDANVRIDGILIEKDYAPASGRSLKISIVNDPDFGPVINFGPGGKLSPSIKDRAIQLPPLNRRLSEDLINNAQISDILDKFGNLPATNREKLRDVLIRVSEIATHLPEVFELTMNPVILDEHDAVVNDVQVVIQRANQNDKLFSHLAIHPYPSDWHRYITIKNNKRVEVRPIRAEDAQAEIDFVDNMSSESKYFRFMYAVKDLTPEMLSNFTKFDYDREMAFGAFMQKKGEDKLLGVSRYAMNPDKKSCEFAIVVDENYQGLGLARQLMLILIEHVKDHDLKIIEGTVLKNNTSMEKLMLSLGFKKTPSKEDYTINIYTLEYDY